VLGGSAHANVNLVPEWSCPFGQAPEGFGLADEYLGHAAPECRKRIV
jgi:hypothetical protein